jgi:hypothetical protein
MRDSRPVASAEFTPDPSAPAASIPDGGLSAMRALAAAAHIAGPRVASGSWPASAACPAPVGRIDLVGASAVPPLHRPTVTGAVAGVGRAGNHVGGAMSPPAANTVALSDGTRISFGAVAKVAEPEYA